VKDGFVKLRVSGKEHESWQRSANVAGLSLSAYVRRCVGEAQALEHALERQVEQERVRQKRRRLEAEQVSRPRPRPVQREERIGTRRPWGVSVGDALRQADQRRGLGGSWI
jgi:Mobilization protein NikA